MAGEDIFAYGTPVALEANGAAISSGGIGVADDADYTTTQSGNFPDADIAISINFTTAPASGGTVTIIAQPLTIKGANNAPTPSSNYPHTALATVYVNPASGTQYLRIPVVDLPKNCRLHLKNNTNQTINAGWTMDVEPKSHKAA